MIFSTLKIDKKDAIYVQIENHIINSINNGELKKDSKLPSTREVSKLLNISRNSVIAAYENLESKGIIVTKRGKGTFVNIQQDVSYDGFSINYIDRMSEYSKVLNDLDIIKKDKPYVKGMISFKSIAPEDSLFNKDEFKRAMLDAWSFEANNLLNYGYAKGYKPLIEYLLKYMETKGVDIRDKDILITNGFTEAFDIILASLTKKGDTILCEEPTHNTALKIMKAYGLNIVQVPLGKDGMDTQKLMETTKKYKIDFAYLIPSYNNPTGIVTKMDRRKEIFNILKENLIPVIEDGFNEELLYSSSPIDPIAALNGNGNGVIYIGSLSKILFPGLRIGWILADKKLVSLLESVKRSRNINSSFLDQSTFYYYMKNGAFDRYLKNVRKYYREKYHYVRKMIDKYIPNEYTTGEGGLHVFIKLSDKIDVDELFDLCYESGVIFMKGKVFFKDANAGRSTIRIGFGRVSNQDIEKGLRIIGENIKILSDR